MGRTNRGCWPAAMLLWVAVSASALAGTERMQLALQVTGAVPLDFHEEHIQDKMHSCALLGPAGAEQTLVLTFNADETQMLLPPSDFGFSLSIAGRVGTTWTEQQPSAILQVSIGRTIFLGLHASDPAFRLTLTVDPGGGSGSFRAAHLRESVSGQTIDLSGSWRCFEENATPPTNAPEISAEPEPKASPAPVDLYPGRRQDEARDERRFRIYHSDACQGADCAIWTVVDTRTGETFAATVAIKLLKLPHDLRVQAQAGQVQLWIVGTRSKSAGGRPVVIARRLEGVSPRNIDGQAWKAQP